MSLDKSIKHGKAHRKPYHGSKRWDKGCRPGGSCGWCLSNRMAKHQRQLDSAKSRATVSAS